MSEAHHAITIGINSYPEFPPLQGAENDAIDFHEWVISPRGGNVPSANAELILSSGKTRRDARPTAEQIDDAFERLHIIARRKGRVGSRLYLFFAGHGFSQDLDETALLMANASEIYTHHLAGRRYAQWFQTAAYFDEVVLFMDCCRQNYPKVILRHPPWPRVENPEAAQVLFFYGFSTYWRGSSHERQFEDGRVHGLFSRTLVQGLWGNAANEQGKISSRSLQAYIESNLPPLSEGVPAQVPRFELGPDSIMFGYVQRPDFPVLLQVSGSSEPLVIKDGKLREIEGGAWERTPEGWRVRLPRGLYQAQVGGMSELFEVKGLEGEQPIRIGGAGHGHP
jgi:uncharacterized caspase-like protein